VGDEGELVEEEFKVMEADAEVKYQSRFNIPPATSDDSDDPEAVFEDHAQLMDSIANYEFKE